MKYWIVIFMLIATSVFAVEPEITVQLSELDMQKIQNEERVLIWNGSMYKGGEYKYSLSETENKLKSILENHEERLNTIEKKLKLKGA